MRTPSSWARRIVARWTSLNSTIRRRRCSGIASTIPRSRNSSSPAQIVGTTNVPARAMQPQRVVVGERAVLDAVDPGLDRVDDALAGMGVGGHGLEVVVGHLDGGPELVERELDGAGVLGLRRQHRARGHHLDEVGALGELAAHRPPHGVGAVGHLVHARVVAHRGRRDREQPAGQEQPRPGDLARVDRVPHGHLHVVPSADVPGGGDARGERPLRGRRGEQRDRGVRAASPRRRDRARRSAGSGGRGSR